MEEYEWELGKYLPQNNIIVDDWIISTQKHCSVNFIDNHAKNRILV